jgi:hypothetical protein
MTSTKNNARIDLRMSNELRQKLQLTAKSKKIPMSKLIKKILEKEMQSQ